MPSGRLVGSRIDIRRRRGSRPETCELTLTRLHPGAGVEEAGAATGWPLRLAPDVAESDPPSHAELEALRALTSAGDGAASA